MREPSASGRVRIVTGPAADAALLSRCLAIRRAVFVVEQGVPEALELEGDAACRHLLATSGGVDVGAARLKPLPDRVAKAQRVAVLAAHRRGGVGTALMAALEDDARRLGCVRVVLGAQTHALRFYERLGYVAEGPEYEEAGIAHRDMTKRLG